jgi:hypothetical protein
VAAELGKNPDLNVRRERGGFGELRVSVDGKDVVDSSVFAYPTPSSVTDRITKYLAGGR